MTTHALLDLSRDFFHEHVLPVFEREFPHETGQIAFGLFGYGSEVLKLDDALSTDHHWGIRINALMPADLLAARGDAIRRTVTAALPDQYRGIALGEGQMPGKGLSLESLEAHLTRTLGIDHAPANAAEWLAIPEEDMTHVIAGEVWRDDPGAFTAVRTALNGYYPEPVRRRRIAHWCRYFSGMGTYALKRAVLRANDLYCNITFTRALRLGVQLAFLIDRRYFPYDKWLYTYFAQLPRMAARLKPLVDEAAQLSTGWARKLELLDAMSDVLDQALVEDGVIAPHPRYHGSPTSGYRLMESAYAEILRGLPTEIRLIVPVWDQVPFERYHAGYVAELDQDTWRGLLNLSEEQGRS
jgi:hypothetical protein